MSKHATGGEATYSFALELLVCFQLGKDTSRVLYFPIFVVSIVGSCRIFRGIFGYGGADPCSSLVGVVVWYARRCSNVPAATSSIAIRPLGEKANSFLMHKEGCECAVVGTKKRMEGMS